MWFLRKKQMNNVAAAGAIPPRPILPPPVVNNYNQTPWGQIIFSAVVAVIVLFIFVWFAIVYLTEQAGFQSPEQAAANCIFSVAFWSLIFLGAIMAGRFFLNDFYGHKERLADKKVQMQRDRLLEAQASVSGIRANSEDAAFARLIMAVMFEAFEHGPRGLRGEIRWSRRMAYAISNQHNLGLSERKCAGVAAWLLHYGVITNKDEINTKRFPSLGDVQRLVTEKFNIPVQMGDTGMSGQYLRGVSGDSWG